MAKKFLTGLRLVNLNSDPSVGSEGELYFNSSASVAKIYKSGAWSELGAGGGSETTVSTTEPVSPVVGDAWYKNDTGEFYIYDGTYWVEVNGVVSLTQEQVQDYVAPLFTHGNHTNASVTYDDALNQLHIDVTSAPTAGFTSVLKHDVRLNGSIAKGQAVYVTSANGTNMIVSKASNTSEATSSKTLGLLETGGSNNALVKVVTEGLLAGLDTSTAGSEGDPVWLGTDGNLIYGLVNKPYAPAHLVFIGVVTRKNSSNGEIFVKVQNGFELEEIHNVGIGYGASIQNNEVLAYNSASGFWVNKTADEAGIATSNSPTFTGSVTVGTDIGSVGASLQITNDIQTSIRSLNNSVIVAESTGVTLDTGGAGAAKSWIFKNNGDLTFPDSSNQSTAFLGIASYSTTNISEGTNLYYTDERAQDAIGSILGAGLAYNDPTGVISNSGVLSVIGTANEISVTASAGTVTVGIPDSPTFVTPNIGVATATSINGTTIPSSKTLVVTTDIGSTVQAYDGDLASIAALTGTSGFLKTNGSGTWSVDTATYSTSAHNHTLNSLSNVVITGTPSDGQAIVWDTSTSKWVNETVSGGASYPDQSGNDGKFLQTNSGSVSWQNVNFSGYLTESSASTTYLTQASASTTYLTTESDTLETVTDRGASSTNAISITNSTAASSTSTGALTVSGGVGIGEDLYVNNNVYIGGDINITGSISGSISYINVTDLVVTDPLIYLADSNPNDMVDIGIFGAYNHSASINYHTGLIRDASDSGKWKLASNLLDPVSNVIDFTGATFDTLKIGALETVNAIGYQYGGTGLTTLGTAGQVLKVNAGGTAIEWGTVSGGSSFTDSAGLAAALSDEVGFSAGAKAVFNISPSFVTSVTGGTTFSAFDTTNNLTIGKSTGYSYLGSITNNVFSGGTQTDTPVSDNYSVRNIAATDGEDSLQEINIANGNRTTSGSGTARTIVNIASGVSSGNGENTVNIGGSTLSTTYLRGVVNIPNSTTINNATFTGPISINGNALIESSTGTSSATSSFNTTTHSSAEFIVYGSTASGNYVSKVLMLARGAATPVITEYAIITQGTAPTVTITPSYSAPNAVLTVAVTSGTNIEIIATEVSI